MKQDALSLGEMVSGDGAFSGPRRTGEGFLPFSALEGEGRIQMANGKIQMVGNLQFAQIARLFDLCHLPFEVLLVLLPAK